MDERKLAGRLRHALRGLEEADKGLEHEEPTSKMRSELRSQIQRLREKLALIAGDKEVVLPPHAQPSTHLNCSPYPPNPTPQTPPLTTPRPWPPNPNPRTPTPG